MRATDDRYKGEKARLELALRMIAHEARTGTIRYWTAISDDRIRKLYASYFKFGDRRVRRRRGRSPSQVGPLVRTPIRALESGFVTNLLLANGLVSDVNPPGPVLRHNVELGHQFCQCFETYQKLVPRPVLSFEWCWNLLLNIRSGEELGIMRCEKCSITYVVDRLAMPRGDCPSCNLFGR